MNIKEIVVRMTATVALLGITFPVYALDVSENVKASASPSEAWAAIAGICSIAEWHPVIASCETMDKDGQPHRMLTTADGGELLEKISEVDDDKMSFSYSIVESPLPIANYVSSLSVSEGDDGGSTIVWTSSFDAAGVSDDDAKELIKGIYRAGLDELKVVLK